MAAARRDILRLASRTRAPRARAVTPARQRRDLEIVLASFAHEMRTPLNGVVALAELIAASDLPARQRDWADALRAAAEHLAQMTTLVVDGARAGTRRPVVRPLGFDCAALARSLGQSLTARAAGKPLRVDLAIADDLPSAAVGDSVLLRAIIENLIDNAVKFTAQGCLRLTVAATRLRDAGELRLDLSVADEGCGMTGAQVARLFRPFAQASRDVAARHGGAGLGLYFSRRVARQMGGSLTVESVPGRGSVFRLAVRLRVAPPVSSAPGALPATPARRLRILCAEDNPYGRVVFNTMAAAFGHVVDFVETGEDALRAAAAGHYDLVLLDIELPVLDGIEAARRLRAERPRLPIIGMSGRAAPADIEAGLAAGMDAYLVKPVGAAALSQAFEAAMVR